MMGSFSYSNFTDSDAFHSCGPQDGFSRTETADRRSDTDETILPSRTVRALQAARKRRTAVFDGDLFADPAWDILLELYALDLEQRRASVSGVYAATSVPASTALRWVSKLEQDGLVARTDDPLDSRRSWIEL